ncbi:hypothetical protein Tco_1264510, partial [Tanacetum coccineum]
LKKTAVVTEVTTADAIDKGAKSNMQVTLRARIKADRLLATRLQKEERAKFLYDTIIAQRRFLAQQRVVHVGGKKHADLKNKNIEEIQVLYKEVKMSDKNFIAIGSAEDERQIKEMNSSSPTFTSPSQA